MRDISRTEGARGLFRGHSATLLRIFPYAAIKFQAYEQIRAVVITTPEQETVGRRLFCGSAAGVTSVFVTYPLEVIRVRLAWETKVEEGKKKVGLREICERIYQEREPIKAGSSTVSASILPRAQPATGAAPILAATVSTAASTTTTTATHVISPAPRSGLVNFYRGFSPTLFGMLPYAGMSFLTHDTMHDILRHPSLAPYTTVPLQASATTTSSSSKSLSSRTTMTTTTTAARRPLKTYAQLLAGGLAGLVSQTAAYPFEVIRRRMQVGGAVGDGHRLRMGEVTRLVWKERGWRGFFVGLGIGYLKVVPMVAVSFWVYERGKGVLGV